MDTLCRITSIIKVWLHSEYCFVNRRYSVVNDLLRDSVLMFEGFPLYFNAFLVCRLVFYRTICAFTKYVKSSHTNKHVGSVHLCLYCSYKNLVGIMFTDKHKNSGIPKKLHRTPQRSTARLCVKLIGRKN